MVRKTFDIGDIIGDVAINSVDMSNPNQPMYSCTCTKCGRTRTLSHEQIRKMRRVLHSSCRMDISLPEEDKKFYVAWTEISKRDKQYAAANKPVQNDYREFTDFYDDMYKPFLEAKDKFGSKNISFGIMRVNQNGGYTKDNLIWNDCTEVRRASALKGVGRRVLGISPDKTLYYIDNATAFAKLHGLDQRRITDCCKGIYENHKGWKFRYIDDLSLYTYQVQEE